MTRQLASKWLKTEALLQHPHSSQHIPHTRKYNLHHLRIMLDRHSFVFIKPIRGGGGNGVIRVAYENGVYSCTQMHKTYRCKSFEVLTRKLHAIRLNRPYLIQQGIQLVTIQGRPIDYRVKVVKEGHEWQFRAVVGRLARPGLVITNLCKGGTLLKGKEALRLTWNKNTAVAKLREMCSLTRVCTSVLERRFPGIGQLGFDYGIDHTGKIWILEVNTRPQ